MTMEADDSTNLRVASFSYYLDTPKERSSVHRSSVSAQDNNNNISIKFSNKDTTDSLRVDSFSCLNTTSASSSSDPVQDPTSAFSFSHQIPKLAAAEIAVFGADKYFNMKLEYQTKINDRPTKLQAPPTPSSCSESTSWNSQSSTLLPDFRHNHSQLKQKKAMAARIFMGIGCRGPCFDKKSIQIDELVAQRAFYGSNQPSRTGSQRVNHQLPLPAAPPPKLKIQDLEESRRSIEVFGSRNRSLKGDVATNMERKLSMLTWDAIPKGKNLPTSAAGTSTVCDDVASEASSDLFEIENISGSVYPLLESKAAAADDASSCMSPASLYAPSEASIQWSVVTASAADYSALSEFNDDSVSVAGGHGQRGLKKEVQKISRPAGFLGCKNHKAVDVAQTVCIKSNKD